MRVAVDGTAIDAAPSGARTRLLHLLTAYARLERRHELVVFLRGDSDLVGPLTRAGLECRQCEAPAGPLLRWLGGGANWRKRIADFHLFQAETLPGPRRCGKPWLVTVHDLRALERSAGEGPGRRLFAHLLLPRDLGRALRVIAVSGHTARQVSERLGYPAERIRVVRNAADPTVVRVEDPERIARFRRELGVGGRYVLALGHLEKRKNLSRLLEAVRQARQHPGLGDLGLVLAGADRDGTAGRLRVESLRSPAVPVVFTGPLGDADRAVAFSAATCLVCPSLVEGFGIVPLEAMAAGCPVIVSDTGALPEVVGDAALRVAAGDVSALARAIESVMGDAGRAADLVRRGRARAAEYDWSRSAAILRDLHDEVSSALGRC